MVGFDRMKIKIHNSLALKNGINIMDYLLNDTFVRCTVNGLNIWIKSSDTSIGEFNRKNYSLEPYSDVNLTPLDLKDIKNWKWDELNS